MIVFSWALSSGSLHAATPLSQSPHSVGFPFCSAGSPSTSFVRPAMFCPLELCTGCWWHQCAAHLQISPTSSRQTGLRPPRFRTHILCRKLTLPSSLHHTAPPSWLSVLKAEIWSSSRTLAPVLLTSIPTASLKYLSNSPASVEQLWNHPVQATIPDGPSHKACTPASWSFQPSRSFQQFPVITTPLWYRPIFLGIQASCHGREVSKSLLFLHLLDLALYPPPLPHHTATTLTLVFLQTKLHLPAPLSESYSADLPGVWTFPSLVFVWILLSGHCIQGVPIRLLGLLTVIPLLPHRPGPQ